MLLVFTIVDDINSKIKNPRQIMRNTSNPSSEKKEENRQNEKK